MGQEGFNVLGKAGNEEIDPLPAQEDGTLQLKILAESLQIPSHHLKELGSLWVRGLSERSKLVGGDVQEGEHLERRSLSHLPLMRVQKNPPT